jgi:hypothetical protein
MAVAMVMLMTDDDDDDGNVNAPTSTTKHCLSLQGKVIKQPPKTIRESFVPRKHLIPES